MGWLAIIGVASAVASSVVAGKSAQYNADAQTEQITRAERAQDSATEQAVLDEQRATEYAKYQEERETNREYASAMAQRSQVGLKGITADRNIDNVLFQRRLDTNYIESVGISKVNAIKMADFEQRQSLGNQKANIKSTRPSNFNIGLNAVGAGLSTYGSTS